MRISIPVRQVSPQASRLGRAAGSNYTRPDSGFSEVRKAMSNISDYSWGQHKAAVKSKVGEVRREGTRLLEQGDLAGKLTEKELVAVAAQEQVASSMAKVNRTAAQAAIIERDERQLAAVELKGENAVRGAPKIQQQFKSRIDEITKDLNSTEREWIRGDLEDVEMQFSTNLAKHLRKEEEKLRDESYKGFQASELTLGTENSFDPAQRRDPASGKPLQNWEYSERKRLHRLYSRADNEGWSREQVKGAVLENKTEMTEVVVLKGIREGQAIEALEHLKSREGEIDGKKYAELLKLAESGSAKVYGYALLDEGVSKGLRGASLYKYLEKNAKSADIRKAALGALTQRRSFMDAAKADRQDEANIRVQDSLGKIAEIQRNPGLTEQQKAAAIAPLERRMETFANSLSAEQIKAMNTQVNKIKDDVTENASNNVVTRFQGMAIQNPDEFLKKDFAALYNQKMLTRQGKAKLEALQMKLRNDRSGVIKDHGQFVDIVSTSGVTDDKDTKNVLTGKLQNWVENYYRNHKKRPNRIEMENFVKNVYQSEIEKPWYKFGDPDVIDLSNEDIREMKYGEVPPWILVKVDEEIERRGGGTVSQATKLKMAKRFLQQIHGFAGVGEGL